MVNRQYPGGHILKDDTLEDNTPETKLRVTFKKGGQNPAVVTY